MSERDSYMKVDRRTFLLSEDGTSLRASQSNGEGNGEGDSAGEDPGAEYQMDDKPTYVQELEERTKRAEEQLARYIKAYKSEVEGELTKRLERLEREAQKELDRMRGQVAMSLLEVLDNFDRSLDAASTGSDLASLHQGLSLVRGQFFGALQTMGVSAISAEDIPFDPNLHEATGMVPVSDPEKDGRVVAVLKEGYLIGERLLRPAVVQVGRLMQ